MRYLVTSKYTTPFYSQWFDTQNHFSIESEMVVFDLLNHLYTTDGSNWIDIDFDHL